MLMHGSALWLYDQLYPVFWNCMTSGPEVQLANSDAKNPMHDPFAKARKLVYLTTVYQSE